MTTAVLCLFLAAVTSCLLQSARADDSLALFKQMRANNELYIREPANADKFEAFIQKYKRDYKTKVETAKRFAIFQDTLVRIKEEQATQKGTATFAINNFADFTEEELKNMKGHIDPTKRTTPA